MEIFQDCGSRPLAFVRFNPDGYYNHKGQKIASCWGATKSRGLCVVKENKASEWTNRLNTLIATIKLQVSLTERKDIDVIHLFYDENK